MIARNESPPPRFLKLLSSLLAMCLSIATHAQTETVPTVDQPARMDGYGDPLPLGAIARLGAMRFRHGGELRQMLFSPDGRALFSASGKRQDISIQACDASTGRRRWKIELAGSFGGISISSDGKLLTVGRFGKELLFLDAATGKEMQPPGEIRITGVNPLFSPNGRLLAAVNATAPFAVHLWDIQGGKIHHQIAAKNFPASLSFSPDSKRLAFIEGGTARVCDAANGKEILRLEVGANGPRPHMIFCCGDKLLAVATGDYDPSKRVHAIRLWDAASGKEAGQLKGHEKNILALAAAPKGNLLASASFDETIRFWDTATQREVGRYTGQSGVALAFSPDGKVLASAEEISILRLWHAPTGGEIHIPAERPNWFWWAGFTPDGRTLITTGEGQFGLWEPLTGRARRTFADKPRNITRIALSPDGKTLATAEVHGDSDIILWDAATGRRQRRLSSQPASSLWPFAFSPDSRTLAASDGAHATIRLFDVAKGKEVRQLHGLPFPVVLAFSPDGTQLISTGLDGRIRFSTIFLYDLVADKELWRKKQQHWFVNDLAFSPDGRTLALVGEIPAQGDQSGEVRLWDAASGEELRRYQGHRGQVSRVVFSPDGRTLATGSYDNTVRLWEVAGGGQRRRFIGHDYVILSISFSPDGRLLATAGGDFNVLIWDLTGRCRDGKYQRLRLSAAELRHCWDDLLDSDAAAAYRSIHALAASPQESVTFLQEHLRPVSAADPKRMASLLAALESDHFAERKQAGAELEKMAFAAEPALRQALQEKPSLESRRRIEQILRKLTNSHGLRARRVIEALELIATPEARRMLTALSGGHAAALPTREAKAALTRLKRRPNVKP